MKDIYIKNDENFYENIKKHRKNIKNTMHFYYADHDIVDDRILKDHEFSLEDKFKICSIHALNLKNIKDRYSYIYDIVCDYLDNEFTEKNICGFYKDVCLSVKNKSHCSESLNGCCYGRNRGLCNNFKNEKCTIKSISCKLFTCRYLKKQKVNYKIDDIPLLKYFFNIRQKFILSTSIFKDKEEMLYLLLKNK